MSMDYGRQAQISELHQVKDHLPSKLLGSLRYWTDVKNGVVPTDIQGDADVDKMIAEVALLSLRVRIADHLDEALSDVFHDPDDEPQPLGMLYYMVSGILDRVTNGEHDGDESAPDMSADTFVRRYRSVMDEISEFTQKAWPLGQGGDTYAAQFIAEVDRARRTVKHATPGERASQKHAYAAIAAQRELKTVLDLWSQSL